jgi:putative component of membrane protein insertase Oxa1/YidC/SpoIIIJ protein YidD
MNPVRGAMGAAVNLARSFGRRPEAPSQAPAEIVAGQEKDWTVLVYLEGRHQLGYSAQAALSAMTSVGSDAHVNVVTQATIEPTLGERLYPDMKPMPTQRLYLGKDGATAVDRIADTKLSESSLRDFVDWGMKNFPARKTMLIVKKHGLGFAKAEPSAPLSAREMRQALEGRKLDVIAFDSCAMQQLEVAYELKDVAKVVTGSEEDVFAIDFPYAKIVQDLQSAPGSIDAAGAGRNLVEAHRAEARRGMQSAVDSAKLEHAASAIHALVDTIKRERLDRSVLYTCMLRTSSMEPQESMRLAFNFRDIRGFLEHLASDPEVTSEAIREAARKAEAAVGAAVIDNAISEGKKRLKDGRGLTALIPWKPLSPGLREGYEKLAFNRDSAWTDLIDYVFEKHETTESVASVGAGPRLSLTQWAGKKAIQGYKKYIAPYLQVSCRCKPSCSQYTRQAIEKHGLVEGTKLGFMRLLTCAGAEGVMDDPVPGVDAKTSLAEPPPVLIDPAVVPDQKSAARQKTERFAILGARLAGRVAGGMGSALAALPVGIALGGRLGWMAGRGTIDDFNRALLEKYPREGVREMVKLEHKVGDIPHAVAGKLATTTGSPRVARMVAGTLGAALGGVLGGLGAAWKGWTMGGLFGALFAGNALKNHFGELPRHPYTESVLARDYAG